MVILSGYFESLNAHSCTFRTTRTALRWPKRAGRQSANIATKQLPTGLLPTNPLPEDPLVVVGSIATKVHGAT